MDIEKVKKTLENDPKIGFEELVSLSETKPINTSLAELWIEIPNNYKLLEAVGKDALWALYDITDDFDSIPIEYGAKFRLSEASLQYLYEDPEISWASLQKSLILDPYYKPAWDFLEVLNKSDAPAFEDGVENIAQLVAQKKFPKSQFELLLSIISDPSNPDKFDLAKRLAER